MGVVKLPSGAMWGDLPLVQPKPLAVNLGWGLLPVSGAGVHNQRPHTASALPGRLKPLGPFVMNRSAVTEITENTSPTAHQPD